MSENPNPTAPANDAPDVPDASAPQQEQPKGFAQEDVNKLVGNARKEARQVAEREVREQLERDYAEKLGLPLEEATAILQRAREAEEARQTDLEKAEKQRKKLETDHQKLRTELDDAYTYIAEMKQEATLRNAFAEAGLKPERVKIALRSADTDLLQVDDEGNVTGAEAVIDALREESPEWFTGARPSSSPDATRRERPVVGVWDMPKDQFEELQARAARGEKVTLPPMR